MQPLEPPGATFKQRESLTTRLRNILDDYPAGLGPYARRLWLQRLNILSRSFQISFRALPLWLFVLTGAVTR